ncbi:hypothetical protein MMC10_007962 [Thelotrema lepadinum]|nr:hypothetical protein [Thelotrema lepadinum]
MSTTTFTLTKPYSQVEVTLPSDLCSKEQLLGFRAFKEWLETMQTSIELQQSDRKHPFHLKEQRYSLKTILIQSVDWFGPNIGFVKMKTLVTNTEAPEKPLAGVVFLRGGSVAILMIIQPEDSDERLVIMTEQPRIPAGSLRFYEIPAGMIDKEGTFAGAAAKELFQETGLKIPAHELTDMTTMALEKSQLQEQHLKKAMFPSPGGCDEFISLMLWEKPMSQTEIKEINGKLTGVDNEQIHTKLVSYDELWREGARDAKTLAAWALYEGLIRDGSLERF